MLDWNTIYSGILPKDGEEVLITTRGFHGYYTELVVYHTRQNGAFVINEDGFYKYSTLCGWVKEDDVVAWAYFNKFEE